MLAIFATERARRVFRSQRRRDLDGGIDDLAAQLVALAARIARAAGPPVRRFLLPPSPNTSQFVTAAA